MAEQNYFLCQSPETSKHQSKIFFQFHFSPQFFMCLRQKPQQSASLTLTCPHSYTVFSLQNTLALHSTWTYNILTNAQIKSYLLKVVLGSERVFQMEYILMKKTSGPDSATPQLCDHEQATLPLFILPIHKMDKKDISENCCENSAS